MSDKALKQTAIIAVWIVFLWFFYLVEIGLRPSNKFRHIETRIGQRVLQSMDVTNDAYIHVVGASEWPIYNDNNAQTLPWGTTNKSITNVMRWPR